MATDDQQNDNSRTVLKNIWKFYRYISLLAVFVVVFLFFQWWGVLGYLILVILMAAWILKKRWSAYLAVIDYGAYELRKVFKDDEKRKLGEHKSVGRKRRKV